MRSLSRVQNEPHLRKDPVSGAVVNVSTDEYHKYMKRKEVIKANNNRIDSLESELCEVRDLLRSVLEKLDNDN